MGPRRRGVDMPLDDFLCEYEFGGSHRIMVSASPERTLAALKQATLGEMPLVRLLFAIRSLPARVAGGRGLPADRTVSLYEQMSRRFVLLAEEPGREIVAGGIGQMWRPAGGVARVFEDSNQFVNFDEPGYAKVAASFTVELQDGRTELRTETRVLTTDPASRRAFGRYWRIIQPGSGLIRRSWLRAARRRAEHEAPTVVRW